jgi:hypothetical protein
MKNTKKFFVVVTSLMLAFAMIGCDQGTKVEYRDRVVGGNGGNNGTGGPNDQEQLAIDLQNSQGRPVYRTSAITFAEAVTLYPGQHLVVGGTQPALSVNSLDAGDGPLFTGSSGTGTLTFSKGLTLRSGSSLTVMNNAVVNVMKAEGAGTGLVVEGGARVGVGVNVTDVPVAGDTKGKLYIATGATASFAANAVLAVAPVTNSVVLDGTGSRLELAAHSKLVVEGGLGEVDSVIGDTNTSVIVIPTEASAGIIDVDVYNDVDDAIEDSQADNGTGTNEKSLNVTDGDNDLVTEVEAAADASEGEVDVTAKYTLATGTEVDLEHQNPEAVAKNQSGISIASAIKDLGDSGKVTIKLTGTVEEDEALVRAWFDTKGPTATGRYAIVTIDGIFTGTGALEAASELKNTNPSWWYYNGLTEGLITGESAPDSAAESYPTLWLDPENAGGSVNWTKKTIARTSNELTLILWSGASTKEATLEVIVDETTSKIIVDWSGLEIKAPADVTAKYPLATGTEVALEHQNSNAVDKNQTGISIRSAVKSSSGVVTIFLTGTVTEDAELVEDWFDTKGADAAALGGNYAIVTIDGLFTDAAKAANSSLKNTNPSWYYYKGVAPAGLRGGETAPTSAATSYPTLWLHPTNAYESFNWKQYLEARTDSELTLLLWSGATPKQAKLEFMPAAGAAYTIIVDWSGVEISASAP